MYCVVFCFPFRYFIGLVCSQLNFASVVLFKLSQLFPLLGCIDWTNCIGCVAISFVCSVHNLKSFIKFSLCPFIPLLCSAFCHKFQPIDTINIVNISQSKSQSKSKSNNSNNNPCFWFVFQLISCAQWARNKWTRVVECFCVESCKRINIVCTIESSQAKPNQTKLEPNDTDRRIWTAGPLWYFRVCMCVCVAKKSNSWKSINIKISMHVISEI